MRSGAAKGRPRGAARLVGAGGRVGTGAATIGAPIAATEMLRGEEPVTALKHGGLYGLLGETVGGVGGRAISKAFGPSKKVVPETIRAQEALVPMGATLTAGQMAPKSRTLGLLENIAEKTFAGMGRIGRTREASREAAETLLRSHLEKMPERGGRVVNQLYEDLGTKAGATTVDFNSLATTVRDLVRGEHGRVPEINKIGRWVTDLMADYPGGQVPFNAAARLRGRLLEVERGHLTTLGSQATYGAAKKFAGSLDEAMEAGAKLGPVGLHAEWRVANEAAKLSIFREVAEDWIAGATKQGVLSGK